jgi:hypothetical protein
MLQPRDWVWALRTFHGGSLSTRARSVTLVLFSAATRAAVRTPSARASAMSTCATPRSSAHRSVSSEPSRSPTSVRSATSKPVTSAWPWWKRATMSASIWEPKSETSWLAAADSWRRSLPTASTRAETASGAIRPPKPRTSLRTNPPRSPADLSFGHSSSAAPAAVKALTSASLRLPPKCTITSVRSGSGSRV